jgi:hypothetical protein
VGNADNSDMTPGIIGIAGAGYVFHDVMEWAMDNYKWPEQSAFPIPSGMAMGAFGCNAGLAPYQGETSGSGGGTGGGTGGSGGTAPSCGIRGDVGVVAKDHLNIYRGYGSPHTHPDIDWYIQGQPPLIS